MENWGYIYIGILIWNVTVLFLYAMDKHRARVDGWRVPERTLLFCAFLCGGIGGLLGMQLLRHKTRHLKFHLLLPLAFLLTLAAMIWLQERFGAGSSFLALF